MLFIYSAVLRMIVEVIIRLKWRRMVREIAERRVTLLCCDYVYTTGRININISDEFIITAAVCNNNKKEIIVYNNKKEMLTFDVIP